MIGINLLKRLKINLIKYKVLKNNKKQLKKNKNQPN